jgi:hypothetical protein
MSAEVSMPVLMTAYVQDLYQDSAEYAEVRQVADRLLDHLNTDAAQALLPAANLPGLSSALVQARKAAGVIRTLRTAGKTRDRSSFD